MRLADDRQVDERSHSDRRLRSSHQRRSGQGLSWMRGRWVIAGASVASGLLLFLAYAAQARAMAATSESSAQALQAWDMLHGNVLLRGWTLSDVTFYTTELPEYMLVELARGLTGGVVHVAAAFTYALLVVLAGLLAAGREAGRDAGRERLVRLLVAAGIMLAPAPRPGTYLLLSAPDHTGTQVPLLTIWLILDRVRARWVPVVIGMLLAWAQIADPLVLYEGVLPLGVVCAVRMYRRRGPLAGQWYELSLTAAALGSVVAARLALALIRQAGGFTTPTLLVADPPGGGCAGRVGRGGGGPAVLPRERPDRAGAGHGLHGRTGRLPGHEQGSGQRSRRAAPSRRSPRRSRAWWPTPSRWAGAGAGGSTRLLRRDPGDRRSSAACTKRGPARRVMA